MYFHNLILPQQCLPRHSNRKPPRIIHTQSSKNLLYTAVSQNETMAMHTNWVFFGMLLYKDWRHNCSNYEHISAYLLTVHKRHMPTSFISNRTAISYNPRTHGRGTFRNTWNNSAMVLKYTENFPWSIPVNYRIYEYSTSGTCFVLSVLGRYSIQFPCEIDDISSICSRVCMRILPTIICTYTSLQRKRLVLSYCSWTESASSDTPPNTYTLWVQLLIIYDAWLRNGDPSASFRHNQLVRIIRFSTAFHAMQSLVIRRSYLEGRAAHAVWSPWGCGGMHAVLLGQVEASQSIENAGTAYAATGHRWIPYEQLSRGEISALQRAPPTPPTQPMPGIKKKSEQTVPPQSCHEPICNYNS